MFTRTRVRRQMVLSKPNARPNTMRLPPSPEELAFPLSDAERRFLAAAVRRGNVGGGGGPRGPFGTEDDPIIIGGDTTTEQAPFAGIAPGRNAARSGTTYYGTYYQITVTERTAYTFTATGTGTLWTDWGIALMLWEGETFDTIVEWLPNPLPVNRADDDTSLSLYFLTVNDGIGNFSATGGEWDGGPVLRVVLEPGTYLLEVASYDEESSDPGAISGTVGVAVEVADWSYIPWSTVTEAYSLAQFTARGATSSWTDTDALIIPVGDVVYRTTLSGTPFEGNASSFVARVADGFVTVFANTRVDDDGWSGADVAQDMSSPADNMGLDFIFTLTGGGTFDQLTAGDLLFTFMYYVEAAAL